VDNLLVQLLTQLLTQHSLTPEIVVERVRSKISRSLPGKPVPVLCSLLLAANVAIILHLLVLAILVFIVLLGVLSHTHKVARAVVCTEVIGRALQLLTKHAAGSVEPRKHVATQPCVVFAC
jgi:hypothetical protein